MLSDLSHLEAKDTILLGRYSNHNGVSRSIALGTNATPADSAHPLALSLHPNGVTPFGLGLTINGQARTIPLIRQRLSAHHGPNYPTLRLSARSAPDQVLHTGHVVVLPAQETLERGITFTLINLAPHETVVVKTHDGRTIAEIRAALSADFKCIDTARDAVKPWISLRWGEVD